METDHLKILSSVFQHSSLASAARDHGIDPSRVSRVVQMVETELGTPLFHRTTRTLSPTEAGQAFCIELPAILEALSSAHAKAQDVHHEPSGVLKLSCPVSFGMLNVVPWLADFNKRHPRITLELSMHDGTPKLGHGGADVAIALGPLRDSDAVAMMIAEMVTYVCCSPAYLKKHGPMSTPDQLSGHSALVLDMPGFDDHWRYRKAGKGKWLEVPVTPTLRTSNALALKQAALDSMGVALLAEWICGRELNSGTLVNLYPDWQIQSATFSNPAMWLLHPAQAYIPKKVRSFIEFLKERFAYGCPGGRMA
jgi:DNA-binding transcriptional LysR family regulator